MNFGLVGPMVNVSDCRLRGLGFDSGVGMLLGVFLQEILKNLEGVFRPHLGKHVKQSVPVDMNFYGNRHWETSALKYTAN